MSERCVFEEVNFQISDPPFYKGPCGECFAVAGREMNNCCFESANRLILQNQNFLVLKKLEGLTGKSKTITTMIKGLNGALNNGLRRRL